MSSIIGSCLILLIIDIDIDIFTIIIIIIDDRMREKKNKARKKKAETCQNGKILTYINLLSTMVSFSLSLVDAGGITGDGEIFPELIVSMVVEMGVIAVGKNDARVRTFKWQALRNPRR